MKQTFYPVETPGFYVSEHGTVTVQVDTGRRKVEVFSDDSVTDADWQAAIADLHSLGIVTLDGPVFCRGTDIWTADF